MDVNKDDVEKRLKKYTDEKKRIPANRSWEAGYVLGWIDALKWIMDNSKNT